VIDSPARPGFRTVGQPVAEAVARRTLLGVDRPASLLVYGQQGSGKTSFADDLLATAFCVAEQETRPCNTCPGCRRARARTHPDLVVASPALWRETRGTGESIVAAARRWLVDVAGTPLEAPWRVIVVEAADTAGEQVQNALLKALEEPSDRQLFILVAEDAARVLPTIRSRCVPLRLGPIPRQVVLGWLAEHLPMTDDQAAALVRLSGGYIGRAAAYAVAPERLAWRRQTQHELASLLGQGAADRITSVRDLLADTTRMGLAAAPNGDEPGAQGSEADVPARPAAATQRPAALAILEAWIDLARDLTVISAGASSVAESAELFPTLAPTAGRLGPRRWATATATLVRIRAGVEQNVSPRLALEVAALGWPVAGG
jgi:hypothetical protein